MTLLVKGPLMCAAELYGTVLVLTIKTDFGWPVEARVSFGEDRSRAAAYAARLPQGTHVTVEAAGALPRSDHGLAVLALSGVARVDARSDSECFVVSGVLR